MTQPPTACPQHCLLCHTSPRSRCDHSEFWLAYPTASTSRSPGIQRLDKRLESLLSLALCEVGKDEADAAVGALCVDRLRVIDRLLTEISSFYQVSRSAEKTQRYDGGSSCTKRGSPKQTSRRDVGTQVLESDLCSDSLQKPRRDKRSSVMKPRRKVRKKKTLDAGTTAAQKALVEVPGSDRGDMTPPDTGEVSDSEHEAEDATSKLDVKPPNNQPECTATAVEPQQDMETVTETVKLKRGRVSTGVKCFTCDKCMASFTKRDKLKRHLRTHSGEKPFECVTCRKRFAVKYQMQRHHTQVHTGERRHRCTVCQHGFTERRPLLIHMRKHTGERPYRCTSCNKTFSQAYSLKLHLLTHSGQLPYKCSWCSAEFSRGDSLKIHTRRHTGERPYSCGTCSRRFADPQNLKKHSRTHATARQRTYKCTVCAASFFRAHSLKEHVRKHTGERPYLCSVCGTSFAHLSSLNHHAKSHSGNKPHSCPHCQATFRDPRVLKVHVRKHTGERPFLCRTCDKGFAHHGQLNRHMLTHTGERPHHCMKCSKKFARKDKLQRHCQVVHGTCPDTPAITVPVPAKSQVKVAPADDIQRPHGCSMCGKHYARKDKLKAHMAKMHLLQPSGPALSTGGRGRSDSAVLVSQTPLILSTSATSVSQIGSSQVQSSHIREANFIQNMSQTTQNLQQINTSTFQKVPTLSTIPNTIHTASPASEHSVTALTVSQHNLTPLTVSQNSVTPLSVSHNVTPLTVSEHNGTPLTMSQHGVTPMTLTASPNSLTPLTVSDHSLTPMTVTHHSLTPMTASQHSLSHHSLTPMTVPHHNMRPFPLSQHNVTPLTLVSPRVPFVPHGVTPMTVPHHNIRPFPPSPNNVTLLTVPQSHAQPSHATPLMYTPECTPIVVQPQFGV